MPLIDIAILISLPEFKALLRQFPNQVKIEMLKPPYKVHLPKAAVPHLSAHSDNPVFQRFRKSLADALKKE